MDVCLKFDSDVKTDDTTHSPREYENIYYAHKDAFKGGQGGSQEGLNWLDVFTVFKG